MMALARIRAGTGADIEIQEMAGVEVGVGVVLLFVGALANSFTTAKGRLRQKLRHVHEPAI